MAPETKQKQFGEILRQRALGNISEVIMIERFSALLEQLEAENRWIPVSERLPERRTKVLTARMYKEPLELEDGFNCPVAIAWTGEENQWWTDENLSGEYKPTHWKPITLPDQALQKEKE